MYEKQSKFKPTNLCKKKEFAKMGIKSVLFK
jgi:hypothetical protein